MLIESYIKMVGLLTFDSVKFIVVMNKWRTAFLKGADEPVMGISDNELEDINISTVIAPYYDKMHRYATVAHAHKMIPNSQFFEYDLTFRDSSKNITEAKGNTPRRADRHILV